jgi:hypothetical protein
VQRGDARGACGNRVIHQSLFSGICRAPAS